MQSLVIDTIKTAPLAASYRSATISSFRKSIFPMIFFYDYRISMLRPLYFIKLMYSLRNNSVRYIMFQGVLHCHIFSSSESVAIEISQAVWSKIPLNFNETNNFEQSGLKGVIHRTTKSICAAEWTNLFWGPLKWIREKACPISPKTN